MTDALLARIATQEARLFALERRMRRLRGLCAVLLLAACALPLLAFVPKTPVEEEVRAHAFVLVDEDDHPHAILHFVRGGEEHEGREEEEEEGDPAFELLDDKGNNRLRLFVQGSEPAMTMLDGKGHTRAGLAVDAGDLPHLVMYDELQRPRLHLAMDAQGLGSATAVDRSGAVGAGFGIDAQSGPWLFPSAPPAAQKPTEAGTKAPEPPAERSPDKHELSPAR